ncbi:thiamine phosphate synthase [Microlunatus soli]|uniref:Thiamine-phosphate synthase n=1 Tax=Microlunatus soli TaxID=630515 RepID=A0A1H1NNP3_9ACTN|nr:thiamine phosphate synthase [Microlunatus soli]SDS00513.1 thiamine-phosphate pyrophosphorylase [Microlunatus soli]
MITTHEQVRSNLGVYLVTAEPSTDRTVELIMAAVAGGVRVVQLRDKINSTDHRIRMLRQIVHRLAGSAVTLVVNDDLDAAAAVPGVGIHVGPDDLHPAVARSRLGVDVCIGWSIHDLDQLRDDQALAAVDYVAASPVWPTPTKIDTSTPFGLQGVRRLRDRLPAELPLVGIGGIDLGNAAEVIGAGADGVAVVSAICAADDPRRAAQDLVAEVDQSKEGRS